MSESAYKQNKEEQRKAERKAEKQARKEANKAKVEETKAEKAKAEKAKKEVKAPSKKPQEEPTVRKVRDIWETLELERQGIAVNENGEYSIDSNSKKSDAGKQKKAKRAKHPLYRKSKGHPKGKRVCVITRKGEHLRVNKAVAETLVAQGGKYIPKHEYKGKVNGEPVDWSDKK